MSSISVSDVKQAIGLGDHQVQILYLAKYCDSKTPYLFLLGLPFPEVFLEQCLGLLILSSAPWSV